MSTSKAGKQPAKGLAIVWAVVALVGVVAWVILLNGVDPQRAWRSLLINFLFFSSLAGGLVVWPVIADTCNAKWHAGIGHLASAAIAFAIPSLLILIVLWAGSPGWAPWYGVRFDQGAWLDNNFVFARDIVVLLLFWGLAGYHQVKRRRGEGRVSGPMLILTYCLVFSLIGFDLFMSLDPHWHSNLAGGYFFISGLYIAMSCWGLLAAVSPRAEADQRHDIGKLMVAFSLMSTYLMYAHLLPFWYENLPREIAFLVPRMHNDPWRSVSYFLLCLVYFGPLVLLLMVRAKKNRWALGVISFTVLVGMWIERWWLVAPTFDPAVRLGLSEISMALACVGLLGLGMGLLRPRLAVAEEKGNEKR